jgi:hypothetical protein
MAVGKGTSFGGQVNTDFEQEKTEKTEDRAGRAEPRMNAN